MISDRVGEHIQKLENKLLKDFQEMGQKAIEEGANVLNETLNGRIETLEQISALQSRTIVNLRDFSKIAEQKVSTVVDSIRKTPSNAVPGFRLEPSAFAGTVPAGPGYGKRFSGFSLSRRSAAGPAATSSTVSDRYRVEPRNPGNAISRRIRSFYKPVTNNSR